MIRIYRFARHCVTLALGAAVVGLHASSNLVENSPFIPADGSAATAANPESLPLELCSVVKLGDDYEFSIYDPATKKSTWARLNEDGHGFVVKAYEAESNTVTVDLQGRILKLPLRQAKIISLGTAPGPVPPTMLVPRPGVTTAGPVPQYIGRGQGPVPTARSALTPEQVRTLEAAVQQRRAMRNAAAPGANQAAPLNPSPGTR